jgi:predicted PurR-regulated permease PerM
MVARVLRARRTGDQRHLLEVRGSKPVGGAAGRPRRYALLGGWDNVRVTMQSNALPMPHDRRWRRLIGVVIFLGLLFAFRKLAPVLICFVVFERTLGWCADLLAKRLPIQRKGAVAALLALIASGLGVAGFFVVKKLLPVFQAVRTDGASYFANITQSALLTSIQETLGIDTHSLAAGAKEYALTALNYVTATAYFALFVFVGFVLAIIYLFERDQVHTWWESVSPETVLGTLTRWLGYVADAIAITVRLQLVVALVNALLTLPLLLVLGLPHVPLLFLLVLIGGLIPVVGGFAAGAVLCVVAYDSQGWVGVGVFLGVAFVLGKVESYYLTPRLTAQHVKVPSLVLVINLLLFETLFGFYGLFLSFPALYVAGRIRHEWKGEDDADVIAPREMPA